MDEAVLMQALMDDIYKALRVNITTGEFQPIKTLALEKRKGFFKEKHIDAYLQAEVKAGFLHQMDAQQYLEVTGLANIQRQVDNNRRKLTHSFRRRVDGTYRWITFEMMIPKDYASNNPWVLYLWKKSDCVACEVTEALRMQSVSYYNILEVNLTDDSFRILKMDSGEVIPEEDARQFSLWACYDKTITNIHEEDLPVYLDFIQLERLRQVFVESKHPIHTLFRRRIGDSYRWVKLDMLPSLEYKDSNQVIMLYVQDIHDEFEEELAYHKHLEYHARFDGLTGVHNFQAYQLYCQRFHNYTEKPSLMAVYADINDLKKLNAIGGYEQGNAYLKRFSLMLMEFFGSMTTFRIGGDRFVVLMMHVNEEKANLMFMEFYNLLSKQSHPMAALGFMWQAEPVSVEDIVSAAEKEMIRDKEKLKNI